MKISFKKEPKRIGLDAVVHYWQNSEIKVDGCVIGKIYYDVNNNLNPKGASKWKIDLFVVDSNDFKLITFKVQFDTDVLAKEWFKNNIKTITQKYNIYKQLC